MANKDCVYSRIVIVDDNRIDLAVNQKMLVNLNAAEAYITFDDPEEAFNYFKKIFNEHEEVPPDLILLDLSMPVIDGFTLLDHFDQWQVSTPVVVITSSRHATDREKTSGYQCVQYYIQKPISARKIRNMLSAITKD